MRMKVAHPLLRDVIRTHGIKLWDGTWFDVYFMSMQLFLVPREHAIAAARASE